MNIDFYKNEDLVKELKSSVFEGDYENIEKWLVKYEINNNPYNAESLIEYITNKYTFNFFVFVPPMNNTKVIDNAYINATKDGYEKRVVSILNHLPLKEQLKLLNYQVEDDFSVNHLKALKFNEKEKDFLLTSLEFNNCIVRLFNKEKFAELDKINEYLKLNTLETFSSHAIIVYKEKNCTHTVTLKDIPSNVLQFQPVYDLLFSYTDKKFNYAVSLGMDLPYREQATTIRDTIINIVQEEDKNLSYKSTRSSDLTRCSSESIDKYKEKVFYFELQHKIPPKTELKNRMKI